MEVMWDYDWVLYEECKDCSYKKNRFTWIEFDVMKQRMEFTQAYQFNKWKLVWFSRHKAEGLNIDDDLNKWENLMWWTRWKDWKQEVLFKPIKELTIPHIKEIIIWWHTNSKEYLSAFTDKLTSVITIKNE